MALPESVLKGLPSLRRRSMLPLTPQIFIALSIFQAVALTPKGMTSTGKRKLAEGRPASIHRR